MKKIMFNDKFGLTQAVLEGRKTMTRRFIKPDYETVSCLNVNYEDHWHGELDGETFDIIPRYEVGEVVAIAQAYKDIIGDILVRDGYETEIAALVYKKHKGWGNKMFVAAKQMVHQIEITNIKVERLQDITEEDARKEGLEMVYYGNEEWYKVCSTNDGIKAAPTAREAFSALIDKNYGKGTWDKNPYVFAYEFELIEKEPTE